MMILLIIGTFTSLTNTNFIPGLVGAIGLISTLASLNFIGLPDALFILSFQHMFTLLFTKIFKGTLLLTCMVLFLYLIRRYSYKYQMLLCHPPLLRSYPGDPALLYIPLQFLGSLPAASTSAWHVWRRDSFGHSGQHCLVCHGRGHC